jgi:CubicO group peptidase (beta-lactamase class C family)
MRPAAMPALFVLAVVTAWCPTDRGVPEVTPDEFVAELDLLVPEMLADARVPGAAVAVIHDAEVIAMRGYGFSDLERGERVTARTGFNIGSISKTVAAWGVMTLVEDGKLDLDLPVERYLTRWRIPDSEFGTDGVTLRRLLSHTAGLSLHGYPGFDPERPRPTIEESLSGETNGSGDVRVILEPGTVWRYSGGGYTLAQLVVEEVTGESFADYLRKAVITPLGMQHSDYTLTAEILAESSRAYDGWGDPIPGPRFTAQAAAGFHTTLEDLTTFALATLEGPDGEAPGREVLDPGTVATMLTPAPASEDSYGLGYFIEVMPDGTVLKGHGGANTGWHATLQLVPNRRGGIVVLTNGSNGWAVHRQIVCRWISWISRLEPGCPRPVSMALIGPLVDDGAEAAIAKYRRLAAVETERYDFAEQELNSLGYALLARGRVKDAIEIFKLNVEVYPDAFNPYDSLGEAYMVDGQNELARINYERSLELDPDNTNAVQMLERLAAEATP